MSKNNSSCMKKTSIGGQALMEGIMMRGPKTSAMAVRNTHGEIIIEKFPTETKKKPALVKWPFIRGVFSYIDSMVMGTKCLMRSAEISGLEEAEEELRREKAAKKAAKKAKKGIVEENNEDNTNNEAIIESVDTENSGNTEEKSSGNGEKPAKKESSFLISVMMFFSVLLGIAFSVLLFIVVPSYAYKGALYLFPGLDTGNAAVTSLIKSVFEGVFKIILLVVYMALISLMKDIKRTFMYHGAEHKTIFCYESGLELTVENVKAQKRFHPRCGTSFLILMLLIGIFISFFIDPLCLIIFGSVPTTLVRTLIRILLLPVVVGIGYEMIKLAGKHDNLFTRIISAPGVWLQNITTKEPDDDMIECAIAAIKEAIPDDQSDNW